MRKTNKIKLISLLIFLCAIPSFVLAQTIEVSGNVKDKDGEPLIGVAVQVEGSKGVNGTITDFDGNYTIKASEQSSLIFSYVGHMSQKVAVKGQKIISITMESTSEDLDEVVVIAYGSQKKLTITGSVSNVSGKEILKSPTPSLANALTAKMPGLTAVQYSGLPGGDDPLLLIRGVTSLGTGSSQPLIMVDGVERSFSQIDPNEVADISILKDASATAVYGVRGANGVVLITTKRGEAGKTQIAVTSSFGLQRPTNFIDMVDSYTYATEYNRAERTDGVSEAELKFSPTDLEHFRTGDSPLLYPNVKWIDYMMKDQAPQSQHNVNISGGNDKARFFVSTGILTQDGLFKTFDTDKNTNFKYNRYNYRANLDIDLGKINTLSLNLGGRLEEKYTIGRGEDNIFRYLMDATPMSGAGVVDGKYIVGNPTYAKVVGRNGLEQYYGQGYALDATNVLNVDLIYQLKLDFVTKGLKFKTKVSYNSSYTKRKDRSSGAPPSYTPMLLDPNDSKSPVVLKKNGDRWNLGYTESGWFSRNWYSEASFDYNRKFGDHDFTALALYNQTKKYYPKKPDNSPLFEEIPTGTVGFAGRVTYNYASRYLLDLNLGYNGSENFAKGRRYGLFPSASLGWIATSEKFMQNQKFITYLKLRYSVGQVGNENMSDNRFLYLPDSYEFANGWVNPNNFSNGYNFGINNSTFLPGIYESSTGNPLVTWETATKQNIGLDLKVLNNRLGVNVDFFKENRVDILITNENSMAGPVARPAMAINKGRVNSHGYELQLSWTDKIGQDFKYTVAPYLSYSRNKIIEMLEVRKDYPWMNRTGLPVNQPFGYKFFDFYLGEETEQKYKDTYGVNFPTQVAGSLKRGDAVYVDLNGDGKIGGDEDMQAMGYPNYPEYTMGTTFNFEYKGFDLAMTWHGVTNVSRTLHGIFRPPFGPLFRSGLSQWTVDNSWTEENKETATLPRMTFANKDNNYKNSDLYIIDASYLRLKNVEIGYNVPKIKKLNFVSNLRVFMNGTNLLTFSKFKGNDPENTSGGYGDFIKYPQMKVYNFGLRVNF